MAKTMKRVISLLLAVVLVVGTFAGCGKSSKDEPPITASAVKFSKSGQYTTTVSSKKVDLSGITADNIEVRYLDPTASTEIAAEESTEAATEAETTEANAESEEEVKPEEIYTLTAKVESVKAADKKSYEITFTDDKAAEYITDNYVVLFKGVEGDDNTANIAVEFPEITLTSDIESVPLSTEEFKASLTISGGEFEDTLSNADLYCTNAFEKSNIEIISKSNNNLTLKVTGEMKKNEADAYQWGIIGVKPTGIKNGYKSVSAKINVKMDYATFDATTLVYNDGKITADLKVYDVADIDTLTKDNIKIDGITVEAADKTDDNTIKLTVTADGVKSANDFADLVNNKQMSLGDYQTVVSLSQATFYPVFDYIEKSDDNFDLTLKLYVYGGAIDDKFSASAIALGEDFEGATVKSVTVDDENLATVIITVPSAEQTEENYSYNGAVILKAGAVTNAWGEATSSDYTYTREYSGETLGRNGGGVSLNTDTLLEIQKYTRGLDTEFGKLCYYAGAASSAFSAAMTVLQMAGVVKSENQQIMEQLEVMDAKLDNIQSDITSIKKTLGEFVLLTKLLAKEEEKRELKTKIDEFETQLIQYNNLVNSVTAMQQKAAFDMALEDAVARGELEKMPSFAGMNATQIAQEKERLSELYLPGENSMTNEEAAEYNVRVMQYLLDKASNPKNAEYYSYNENVRDLENTIKLICGLLNKPTGSNPIGFYDELVSMLYNFDSETYDFRLANRVALQYKLTEGMWALAFHFQTAKYPESSRYALVDAEYGKAMKSSIWTVSGHPASEIEATPHYVTVKQEIYIKDVKLAQGSTASATKNALTKDGYAVIEQDLDAGTGGDYIYLGYKTTNNYEEAIGNFYVYKGSDNAKEKTFDGLKYTLCGSVASNTHDIWLYYTKQKTDDAVYTISFTSADSFTGSGNIGHNNGTGDLNDGEGGKYIHMTVGKAKKGKKSNVQILVGMDAAYYPYSYMFGCKISAYSCKYTPTINELKNIYMAGYRSFSGEELTDFTTRLKSHYNTLQEQMTAAGFEWGICYNGVTVKPNQLVLAVDDEWKDGWLGIDYMKNGLAVTKHGNVYGQYGLWNIMYLHTN